MRDYLITDPTLAKVISQDAVLTNSDETLLVSHDEEGLALSLFLDAEMLGRLESSDPLTSLRAESLDDLWKVLEGISHFNYLAWNAAADRPVTQLEMEMQAEVDKYVAARVLLEAQADSQQSVGAHWLGRVHRHHEIP